MPETEIQVLEQKVELLEQSLKSLGIEIGEDPFRPLAIEEIKDGMWIYDSFFDNYIKVERVMTVLVKGEKRYKLITKSGSVTYGEKRFTRYAKGDKK